MEQKIQTNVQARNPILNGGPWVRPQDVGVHAHSESVGWEERLLHGTVESKGMEWGRGGEGPPGLVRLDGGLGERERRRMGRML